MKTESLPPLMKITIEITEEDAAAIWANHWKRQPITETIAALIEQQAGEYRSIVPSTTMAKDIAAFRAAHPRTAIEHDREFQAVDTSKMFPPQTPLP